MKKTTKTLILLLCVLLALPLVFAGCSADGDEPDAKEFATDFVEAVIADDFDLAYSMCSHMCTRNELWGLWLQVRTVLWNTSSYTIYRISQDTQVNSDGTMRSSIFEIKTEEGKTCYLQVVTTPDSDKVQGISFQDSTAFFEETSYVLYVNIGLILYCLLCLALIIWMIVDCAKRPLRAKAAWILLILVGGMVSLSFNIESFVDFHIAGGLFLPISLIVREGLSQALTITLRVPIGAIVYLCIRKRVTKTPAPAQPAPFPAQAPHGAYPVNLPPFAPQAPQAPTMTPTEPVAQPEVSAEPPAQPSQEEHPNE